MAARLEAMGQQKYVGLTTKVNGNVVWTGKINLSPDDLSIPLNRKKPTTYFVNSMSDLFHPDVPFEYVDKVFAVMALCPQHVFQVLTKRPERMAEYANDPDTKFRIHYAAKSMEEAHGETPWPLPNVWLGTSVENQKCADERIPHLLRCPAAVRFLSAEPLLGPIDLSYGFGIPTGAGRGSCPMHLAGVCPEGLQPNGKTHIHWVIVGGESGPGARPFNVQWARDVIAQCKAAGVACFVKQFGGNVSFDGTQGGFGDGPSNVWPFDLSDRREEIPGGWRIHLKDKKGGAIAEWPVDLRVREMPAPVA